MGMDLVGSMFSPVTHSGGAWPQERARSPWTRSPSPELRQTGTGLTLLTKTSSRISLPENGIPLRKFKPLGKKLEELKWRAKKSQQETGPIIRKLYEVNGVTVKTPVSTATNKFRSVEIIKPLKPREVNKCWRRNPGSSPGDRLVE